MSVNVTDPLDMLVNRLFSEEKVTYSPFVKVGEEGVALSDISDVTRNMLDSYLKEAYNMGYDSGFEDGQKDGYDEGYNDGYDLGQEDSELNDIK